MSRDSNLALTGLKAVLPYTTTAPDSLVLSRFVSQIVLMRYFLTLSDTDVFQRDFRPIHVIKDTVIEVRTNEALLYYIKLLHKLQSK